MHEVLSNLHEKNLVQMLPLAVELLLAVVFTGGELCDYTFGYDAFPLWVSNCPFLGSS